MKETSFIKQNKKKWARFEKLSGQRNSDPDEVSELFTEITEDLSYARTFYPRRSVRVYLNQLSQGVFTSLYKQYKQPVGNFFKFWTESVPLEMYRARWNLLIAFLFFGLAVFIGAISQHYDHDFVRIILGDGYVDMTEQNIKDGNPMGVYGDSPGGSMFWRITINNIKVAFMAFVLGILGSVLTFFLLLTNGVMLGAFQWWFKAKGLLLTTFLTIWIHGAFEISSIVLAGAAGITVGNGLLFPRSYTRIQSMVFAAKRGLYIMLSLIPFFVMAGFLESYVTRHYQTLPNGVKWGIIIISFAVIVLYYVVYPFIVARKHPDKIETKEIPRFVQNHKFEWFKIRKVGEVFTETFHVLMERFNMILRLFLTILLPLAIGVTIVAYAIDYFPFTLSLHWYENWGAMLGSTNYFEWAKFGGWCLVFTLLICGVYFVIHREEEENLFLDYFKFIGRHGLWIFIYTAMIMGIVLFSPGLLLFLLAFAVPILGMIPSIIVIEKTNFFTAFGRSFNLGKGVYGDNLGSFMVFFLISGIFFFVLINPMYEGVLGILDGIVREMTITVMDDYYVAVNGTNSFFFILYWFFVIGLMHISFAFNYYSSEEKKSAKGLYEKLEKFGKRSNHRETDLDYE